MTDPAGSRTPVPEYPAGPASAAGPGAAATSTGGPAAEPADVRPGWAPFLVPGRRVVVRSAIDPASSPGGERMTDALGPVVRTDARTLTIMTRRGEVTVLRGLVLAAKPVPDPPVRRARTERTG